MRNTKHFLVFTSILIFFFATGCEKKSAPPVAAKPAGAPGAAGAPPAAAPKLCPNGQQAKVVSGSCTGSWRIKRDGNTATCEFEWGPTVKCPEGTKAIALEAACYGVTGRPVPAGAKVSSPEDCAASFGKVPLPPAYSLECC